MYIPSSFRALAVSRQFQNRKNKKIKIKKVKNFYVFNFLYPTITKNIFYFFVYVLNFNILFIRDWLTSYLIAICS